MASLFPSAVFMGRNHLHEHSGETDPRSVYFIPAEGWFPPGPCLQCFTFIFRADALYLLKHSGNSEKVINQS